AGGAGSVPSWVGLPVPSGAGARPRRWARLRRPRRHPGGGGPGPGASSGDEGIRGASTRRRARGSGGDPPAGRGALVTGPGALTRAPLPHLAPGRMGLRLAVLSVAIGLAAINTGNNLLYVMLSLILGLALVASIAARVAMRTLRVRAILPPE